MKSLAERIEFIFSHSLSNMGKKSFGNTSAATVPYKKNRSNGDVIKKTTFSVQHLQRFCALFIPTP